MASTITNTNGKRTMSEPEQEEAPVVAKCAKTGPTPVEELEQELSSIINNAPDLNDQEKLEAIEKLREFEEEYVAKFRVLALCEVRLLAQLWVSDLKQVHRGFRPAHYHLFGYERFELSNACAFSDWWDSYVTNFWSGRFVEKHEIDNMLQELNKYKTYYQSRSQR